MPKIGELSKQTYNILKPYGISSQDVRLLIMHNEGLQDQIDVILKQDQEAKHADMLPAQIERLKNNEPIEYIINEAYFLMKKLYVNENVLIPRGETEELVANLTEEISNYYDPRNFLVAADLGTGSGAIAISLSDNFPNWIINASDISKGALEVAKINCDRYAPEVRLLEGDALEPFIENNIKLDIIVSNPPYITPNEEVQNSVRGFEPASALWFDENNSVYEKIFRDYEKVKKGSLFMAFEISPELEGWLVKKMKQYLKNYEYHFLKDMNGFTRFLFINIE